MKKNILFILFSLSIFSCTNTAITSTSDTNKINISQSPTITTTSTPIPITETKEVKVKNIFSFPEYLVMKKGETKNIYSKIQMSDNSYNNDFIITSSDTSIIEIKDNSVHGLKEGLTKITIASKQDISKSIVIPVEVQDKELTYQIKIPNPDLPYYNSGINQFYIDSHNDLFLEYHKNDNLYSYTSKLNKGFQNWKQISHSGINNTNINNKFYLFKDNIFVLRKDINTNKTSGREIITYNLYVDIYEKSFSKRTIKINSLPLIRDETEKTSYDGEALISYPEIFNSSISIDDNGNFAVVWTNQFKEYRAKLFNKDGEEISSEFILDTYEDDNLNSFSFDISSNHERLIFSKMSYWNKLDIKVFDKNLNKLYDKNAAVVTDESEKNHYMLSNHIITINDLGEFVIGFTGYKYYTDGHQKVYLKKFTSLGYKTEYDFNLSENITNELNGLSINNDFDISTIFFYDITKNPGARFIPGDKNKADINLKKGEKFKLDEKYSNFSSSNESVIKINNKEIVAEDVGTSTISCIDENNYEKSINLKVNVSF